MFNTFEDIFKYIIEKGAKKKVAVASAEDEDVLESVLAAYSKGIIEPVLVGKGEIVKRIVKDKGYEPDNFQIIDIPDSNSAAKQVAKMVSVGEADIPMKGLLQTSEFLRAILDKELKLIDNNGLISQATICQYNRMNKMIIISDCAININPDIDKKIKIINNTIKLAQSLGYEKPKVVLLAPVEVVNYDIPVTTEAAILSKMSERGQIKNAVIDGPLGLDNAVSLEAAQHKGIKGEVAGRADILIVPDLTSGNIFHKSLSYFSDLQLAGTVLGANCPIIMTSRTDTPEVKFNSILISVLMAS